MVLAGDAVRNEVALLADAPPPPEQKLEVECSVVETSGDAFDVFLIIDSNHLEIQGDEYNMQPTPLDECVLAAPACGHLLFHTFDEASENPVWDIEMDVDAWADVVAVLGL